MLLAQGIILALVLAALFIFEDDAESFEERESGRRNPQ